MRDRVVLVCGARDLSGSLRHRVWQRLDDIRREIENPDAEEFMVLVTGGAGGADRLAVQWAIHRNVDRVTFDANFDGRGAAGGPIRNARMLAWAKPELVVAFPPGPSGTYDMVAKAEAAGIPVVKLGWGEKHKAGSERTRKAQERTYE